MDSVLALVGPHVLGILFGNAGQPDEWCCAPQNDILELSVTVVWVDHRVDWWSFGILIYELLYGFTPFRGKKRDETFNNILKRPLNFPEQPEVSEACKVHPCS